MNDKTTPAAIGGATIKVKSVGPNGAKVLVIGSTGHANVSCVSWNDAKLPNIVDFHVCILAVQSLTDKALLLQKHEHFEKIAQMLRRLLMSGGTLIVVGDKFRRIKTNSYPESICNYQWCPFDVSFRTEAGDTVEILNEQYPSYIHRINNWQYHYECSDIDPKWKDFFGNEDKIQINTSVIVANRERRILAGSHRAEIYGARRKSNSWETYTEYADKPDQISGEFVFLPPIFDIDEREGVNLILQDMGIRQITASPAWIEGIAVPGATEIGKQIEQLKSEIGNLEDKAAQLQSEHDDLRNFTQLLYSSGSELEEIFRDSLTRLGGKVVDAKYSKEEYILEWQGHDLLVEVKGNSKSISLDNLRQLLDYTIHYLKDTGKDGKGILFGNAWRLLPLDERDTADKPYFPDDVRRTAEKHGIALLSSKVYFDAFCRFLKGELTGAAILDKLSTSKGVVTF